MRQYKITAVTGQHIGNESLQQDRVALVSGQRAPGYMLAVLADGSGGPKGGAAAAEQAVQTAKQLFTEFSPIEKGPAPVGVWGSTEHFDSNTAKLEAMVRTIVKEAHLGIKLGQQVAEAESHCSLAVLALAPDGSAVWGHVGDARLYRFSGQALVHKTGDADYVDALMREGKVTLEAARGHRKSALLLNAVGSKKREPHVTLGRCDGLAEGDAFLLCSPGLWRYFSGEELAAAVARAQPREVSEKLVEKAGARASGKGENCTFAIVKLEPADKPAKPASHRPL
jgi:serine/threonine protein phosphatase PrpC